MSAPLYPLGTVAMTGHSGGGRIALRGASDSRPVWRFPDGGARSYHELAARPLVVLDPTDAAQMATFWKAYMRAREGSGEADLRTALVAMLPTPERTLVTEEPMGPAARPVDCAGDEWARASDGDWACLAAGRGARAPWPKAVKHFGPFYLPVTP